MKRNAVLCLAALVATSCGPTPAPAPSPPVATVPAPVAQTPLLQSRPAQRPPRTEPSNAPRDLCGAGALQYLVGKPRSEIPVPVNVRSRRVTCTSCPVTMDFREDRLNILFDADTGVIKQVKCG